MTTHTGNSATSEKLIKPSLRRLFEAVAEFQQEFQQISDQPPEPQQRIDVFARFREGDLVTCNTTNSGKSWSKRTSLDVGVLNNSRFQAVSFNPERIDVFSSRDGVIGHRYLDGQHWLPHPDSPKEVMAAGWYHKGPADWSPTVAKSRSHAFILFYVDSYTRKVWYRFGNYDWMDWSDWACLGGKCNSKPVAISRSRNIVDLFYVGLDGGLYWNSWTEMAWKPEFEKLGIGCKGDPEAVALHRERIDVFVVSSGGDLWTKVWDGKVWGPLGDSGPAWRSLGGSFGSRPAVVARSTKRFDLFIIGVDGKLYHKALDNSTWMPSIGFRNLGGNFNTTISPTAVLTKSGIHVFLVGGEGASGGAYHKCWDGVDEEAPWEFDQFFGWHCSTPITAIVRDIGD